MKCKLLQNKAKTAEKMPSSPKPMAMNKVFYTDNIIGFKLPFKKSAVPMARLITGMDMKTQRQNRLNHQAAEIIQKDLREAADQLQNISLE